MSDVTGTFWFLLFVLAVTVSADVFDFNKEVDGFLGQFRDDILEAENMQVPLPKIRVQYTEKVLFFNINGEFNGTHGTIGNLSTIKRTGNASLVTVQDYFVFRTEFGFGELKIGYEYKGRFMGIPLSGQLDLSIGGNSVYVEILLNFTNNRCSGVVENIRQVRFATLNNIKVKVTGFSLANRFVDYLLSRSFNHVSPNVIRPIEDSLKKLFQANFRHFDFCKFGKVPDNQPFDEAQSSDDVSSQMYPDVVTNTNFTAPDVNAVLD